MTGIKYFENYNIKNNTLNLDSEDHIFNVLKPTSSYLSTDLISYVSTSFHLFLLLSFSVINLVHLLPFLYNFRQSQNENT